MDKFFWTYVGYILYNIYFRLSNLKQYKKVFYSFKTKCFLNEIYEKKRKE